MKINGRYLLLALCLIVLGACDDDTAEKAKKVAAEQASQVNAEQNLMADPTLAAAEWKRRLRDSVKIHDGLIVVDGHLGLQTFVLSSNAHWMVTCGFIGMTVVFGNSRSQSDSNIEVRLTWASIDKSGCTALGPAVGKEIQEILAGR